MAEHRICLVSLGCDKNLVDSRKMLYRLLEEGKEDGETFVLTDEASDAEILLVNTCCFIDSAKEESIEHILEAAKQKEEGNCRILAVTGCMAERYRKEIEESLPEVDVILDMEGEKDVRQALLSALDPEKEPAAKPADEPSSLDAAPQFLTAEARVGYLKIADGCDKYCSYCVIPSIRGHYRSVPMEEILKEAAQLAERDIGEFILIAQETTRYGLDLYGKKMLPELLRRLCLIRGVHWIRVLYCYPEEIDEELIRVMASEKKILPYIDMPIQHCSDRILSLMGRRTSQAEIREKVRLLREAMPDICIRTSLITGFPTETEEDHRELMDFVRDMRFDRLGVFTYSREEGTKAAQMEGQVHHATKKRRQKELMLLQQEIAFAAAQERIGTCLEAVVEGRLPAEGLVVGRTVLDIPDVDANILIETDRDPVSGSFMQVRVTGSSGYDLIGVPADED